MPPKRASSTKSTAAKSTPSKPARPATTAKAAASAGKGKATAAKARAKPKPKPVTKLAPEYPSSTPRRSSRQGPKRAGSGEAVVPSKKAKLPPDQGDNRTGSVVDSLGAYNQAVGENPDGASEALDVLSVSDVIPDDILNQAMDDHDAKTEKHEPKAAKHVEEANFRREQDEFATAFSRTGPFDTTQTYTPCRSEVKADAEEQASVDDAIAQSKADAECKSHIDAAAAEFGADPRTGTVPASAPPDKLLTPPRAMSIAGEARPFPTPAQRRRAEANRAIAKAKLKTAALKAERTAKKQQAGSVKSQSASSAVQVHAMPGVTHFASPSPSRSRSARGDRKRAAVGDAFGASLGARSSFQMFQRFQHQSFQQFQAMLRAEGILDSNNMARRSPMFIQ